MVPKKQEAEKENNERWLVTYSDLITLLLIYFIVLYSMSQINAQKFSELSQSMAVVFGQTGRSGVLDGGRSVMPDPSTHKEKKNMSNTKERIRRMIAKMGLNGKITMRQEARGLVISVKDTVFFYAGSADLGPRAKEIISNVAAILSDVPNSIRIEGHTDNIPIHNARFYSNWELSTARATNVLHYLVKSSGLSPDRLSAAGYGEYRPVESNSTEQGRSSNRRVDIVVVDDEFEKFEPSSDQGTSDYIGPGDTEDDSGSESEMGSLYDEEL